MTLRHAFKLFHFDAARLLRDGGAISTAVHASPVIGPRAARRPGDAKAALIEGWTGDVKVGREMSGIVQRGDKGENSTG